MPASGATQRSAELTEQDEAVTDELGELVAGLSRSQKSISPKFFYDEKGSQLFDEICELPEYYLTRTELGIMRRHVGEMAEHIGPQASLIEFGSGSSVKIRILLENLDRLAAYVPVDISKDHLVAAADAIARDFPEIEVLPVAADFTKPFDLPSPRVMPLRNIVYFPGSTIGNFSHDAAAELLKVMHHEAGEDGGLLIGIDLQKERSVIESAYNDASGVTAEFNLNLLERINREFGADFDTGAFEHRAVYDEDAGRIEMRLVSREQQTVRLDGASFEFVPGEYIVTEHSHKYTIDGFGRMLGVAGFEIEDAWTDSQRYFAILYCRRR